MAFIFSHYTLQGYLLRRDCELLSTPKLLLHPTKHDLLHSKCISVEVIDQKDKLWGTLREQLPKRVPVANVSTLQTVKLIQRRENDHLNTYGRSMFLFYQVYSTLW